MAKKARKVHKMRGHGRGYGSKKKHRGKGSQGGSGRSGLWDHKKILVLKTEPERFGTRGFRSLAQRGLVEKPPAITLRELQKLAGDKKEIDIVSLGYGKVIGRQKPAAPLTVKARAFSAGAKAAIEAAKGKAEVST